MPSKRRLQGIAALSAGALAAGGVAPAGVAQSPDEAAVLDPATAAASEAALHKWEAERGIDVPDDLFLKLGDASSDPFLKLQYLPATDTTDAAIIQYDYQEGAAGDAFNKLEFGIDDPLAAELLDGIEELFPKVELPDLDGTDDDPFLKLSDLVGTDWAYQAGDRADEDAFYKLEVTPDGESAALVTWEYDAIDLVERSLIERAGSDEAGGEVDPASVLDPVIEGLLDGVRGLRAAGAAVNAFTERDRAMKSLPLPKKLPADAGTYATPKAGRWRAVNLPGTVKCGGFTRRIPKTSTDRATLQVLDGGQRLVGRELGEKGSKFVVSADPEITGRYTGSVNVKGQGGRVDMDLTMQLITDRHIVGSAKVTVKAGGQRCRINRGFDVKYRGE